MSDGAISQDEIDALLSGVDMGGITGGNSSSVNIDTSVLEKFADGIKDELKTKLNSMTGSEFSVETPKAPLPFRSFSRYTCSPRDCGAFYS